MILKYILIILALVSSFFLVYDGFKIKSVMKKENVSCKELKTMINILMFCLIILYLTLMVVCVL